MAEPAAQPDPPPGTDEVRYLPVPATRPPVEATPPRPIERAVPAALPATVAAAGGFLLGVATFVMTRVLRRRLARRSLGRALGRRGGRSGVEIAGSRSFLVDIHLLRR